MHRLKWTEGRPYGSIADDYASFTCQHCGCCTVVFDGYDGGPTMKDNAHQRRSQNRMSNKVDVSDATKLVGKR